MRKKTAAEYGAMLRDAIFQNANRIFRDPEGCLKRPFVDPGAQYSKALWDWDSYWASVALCRLLKDSKSEAEKDREFRVKTLAHIKGSLLNFFDHQGKDGSLPISLLPTNADVFESRKRPGEETNMAKPVMGQFLRLIVRETKDADLARRLFGKLMKFYACYRKRYQHETGLFVWGSDVAIGVDDDPATFCRPEFSSANIYLNCLMAVDLTASAEVAGTLGRTADAARLKAQARDLTQAIQTYCWDERDGFFYSVDVQCRHHLPLGKIHKNLKPFWKTLPLKVMVWTGFLPLWAKLATPAQARRMVREHLFNEKQFLSKYGIRSLSADERMYEPTTGRGNPSNWLGPIWIIVQYIIWQGLKNYGYDREAGDLARRTIHLLGQDIAQNGCLHEYYSPETGKGIIGKGFWNWNNLVLFMLEE